MSILTPPQLNSAVQYNVARYDSPSGLTGLTPADLATLTVTDGTLWADFSLAVARFQRASGLTVDGKLGPATLGKVRAVPTTTTTGNGAVVNGQIIAPPAGVSVTNWHDNPKLLSRHVKPRTRPVTQFVLHRGAETQSIDPMKTKDILDGRELSSLFTLTPDGRLYQHFDPATHRGAHATHHNVQSDSLDVQGPLSVKRAGMPGQVVLPLRMAIGLANGDAAEKAKGATAQRAAVLARKMVTQKQWSITPEQQATIRAFLPWWCGLRAIPIRACSEFRTFRVGGLGVADPVTNVTGILAHAQCSGPGERVDGFAELAAMEGVPGVEWRGGVEFWT